MSKLKIGLFLFFMCTLSQFTSAQKRELNYEVGLSSSVSSESTLPFWLVSNKNGIVPDENNGLLETSIFSDFVTREKGIGFSYGTTFIASLADNSDFLVGQLYGGIQWKDFQLIVGSKYEDEKFGGLSSSNGAILSSKNARSYPGINLKVPDFVSLPIGSGFISVKGNWAEYLLNDTRAVDNAHLHHKSLYFKFKTSEKFEIIAGLDDYAQWSGESATQGKQPSGFKDYIRVVIGYSGGSGSLETDQINALGNHIGAYHFQLKRKGKGLDWSFYWSHPFEDRSGRELANAQDGLYGLFLDFKNEKKLISQVLYEFYYTKNQSGSVNSTTDEDGNFHIGSGADNYFNNGVYSSGWTYFGRTIGSPFFTAANQGDDGITLGITNNRFVAHHIGVNGFLFEKLPYRVLLSYTINSGTYSSPLENTPKQLATCFEMKIPEGKLPFELSMVAACDFGDYWKDNYGIYIRLFKKGIF
jgi:hypothetical protein